jgi:hypothetical protein
MKYGLGRLDRRLDAKDGARIRAGLVGRGVGRDGLGRGELVSSSLEDEEGSCTKAFVWIPGARSCKAYRRFLPRWRHHQPEVELVGDVLQWQSLSDAAGCVGEGQRQRRLHCCFWL